MADPQELSPLSLEQFVAMADPEDRLVLEAALAQHNLAIIEEAVLKNLGRLAFRAWQQWLQDWIDRIDDQPRPTCPVCGNPLGARHRRRERKLETSLGTLSLQRNEYRCCDKLIVPADAALGLREGQRLSPFQEELAEEFGADARSFPGAKRLLGRVVRTPMQASTINDCVDRRGAALRAEAERQAEEMRRSPEAVESLPCAVGPGEFLVVQSDGGFVPTIGGYREAKVGSIYPLAERYEDAPPASADADASAGADAGGRGHVRRSFRVGGIDDWQTHAMRLEALARRLGSRHARVVLLGDGAAWIDEMQRAYFPGAIRILDFWHAMEHICEPASLAFVPDSSAAAATAFRAWRRAQHDRLLAGNVRGVLAAIRALARRKEVAASQRSRLAESIRTTTAYLSTRREQMDYPRYRALGLPIASGLIEGTIRSFKQRLNGPGMRWRPLTATHMLELLCHQHNQRSLAA